MTLTPERAPAAGEALWLEVFIGALPPEATLVISDHKGREIGGISPFGKAIREAGGSHLLPLPADLQKQAPIQLRVELRLKTQTLKPTSDELRDIKLVYVPVSK